MKRFIALLSVLVFVLCSCTRLPEDSRIVGKWIDMKTEQIIEYTADGYYYEYINESFTADKTRYTVQDGKLYYYLDKGEPDMSFGIDYEIKDGHLFIAGVLEYKPMDIKTSIDEME